MQKAKVFDVLAGINKIFCERWKGKRYTSAAARLPKRQQNVCVRNKSVYNNCVSLRMFEFEEMCGKKVSFYTAPNV